VLCFYDKSSTSLNLHKVVGYNRCGYIQSSQQPLHLGLSPMHMQKLDCQAVGATQ
jgi:hypothetical protein